MGSLWAHDATQWILDRHGMRDFPLPCLVLKTDKP